MKRQLLAARMAAARESETRAAREYKSPDESYTTVRRKLAADWEAPLQTLQATQQR